MQVVIAINHQTGIVTITIPDRNHGGIKDRIDITSLDAIQLHNELNKLLLPRNIV